MTKFDKIPGYTLLGTEKLTDVNSVSYVLIHNKTKARFVLIENDDDNKAFLIGFKTPQDNSTGVPHILEHSVLCGSKKFPVKDAMSEVSRGSLNTFLNAFTYPDRTIYPVSSCNDKDFQNLIDVYLDAVFFPRVYDDKRIFMQEGWHYELESKDADLIYNGVVYNEMKGVYSSPVQLLSSYIQFSLFPDTQYGVESGGDPDVIPSLTYEDFINFHKKLYHPSNSRIFLYGNMDFEEKLKFIDEEYLSQFEYLDVDSTVTMQEVFFAPKNIEKSYSVSMEESEENGTYLTYNVVCSDYKDIETTAIMDVINYALCSVPGAKLKQRLLDENIGMDVYSELSTEIGQKTFSIIAENANAEDKDRFVEIIEDTIKEIIAEGFDKKTLEASITSSEFAYREADFGYYPKGIAFGMMTFDEWNYVDDDIFNSLKQNEVFAKLRKGINEGLFERVLSERVLNNNHKSILVMKPERGLQEKKDDELKEKLSKIKASFTDSELEKIINDTRELKAYQEEPDSPEALKTVPHLKLSDMKKDITEIYTEEELLDGVKLITTKVESNGILYAFLNFDIDNLPVRLYPALSLLKIFLGSLNTKNYKFGEFINEVNIVSGGLNGTASIFKDANDTDNYKLSLEVKFKTFYSTIPKCLELVKEMLFTSDLHDKKRIKELVLETKTRLENYQNQSGHIVGINRVSSYFSKSGKISETISGYGQYITVSDLAANFDGKIDLYIKEMEEILNFALNKEGLSLYAGGEKLGIESFKKEILSFISLLPSKKVCKNEAFIECLKLNEALSTPGQVAYVSCGGNFKRSGLDYDGSLLVLKEALTNDYLWTEIRLKGGAYGMAFLVGKNGDLFFTSYRDPNCKKTLENYKKSVDYIESFPDDEELCESYIISAIGNLDAPLTPSMKVSRAFTMYRCNLTNEMYRKERQEILSTTPEKIRSLSKYIEESLKEDYYTVIGAESILNKDKDLFATIETLVK